MFKLQHWNTFDKVMIDINEIRDYCQRRGFEVCSRMGERMGIAPGVVRMYFIYTSFLAFGSPLIIYLVLAFWIKVKDYARVSRHSVLDL